MSSPLAKGVPGGIAAYGVSRVLGGPHGHHNKHGLFSGGHNYRHGHHGGGFFDFEGPDLGIDDMFEGDFGYFGGDGD